MCREAEEADRKRAGWQRSPAARAPLPPLQRTSRPLAVVATARCPLPAARWSREGRGKQGKLPGKVGHIHTQKCLMNKIKKEKKRKQVVRVRKKQRKKKEKRQVSTPVRAPPPPPPAWPAAGGGSAAQQGPCGSRARTAAPGATSGWSPPPGVGWGRKRKGYFFFRNRFQEGGGMGEDELRLGREGWEGLLVACLCLQTVSQHGSCSHRPTGQGQGRMK